MQSTQHGQPQDRLHWRELQLEETSEYPTEEPVAPRVGDRWYDQAAHCLCIWDGIEWDPVPLD